jgi:hypothetical protein
VKITVKADLRPILRALDELGEGQVPFAVANALTQTAKEARDAVKNQLKGTYVLRNRFTEGGMRMRPATKRSLKSEVGSLDPYMASQAKGGVRQKGEGRPRGKGEPKAIAVPSKVRPGKSGIVPRGKWPGKLVLKPRHFFQEMKSGAVILFGRKGKTWVGKGKKRRRGKILPLWVFVRRVRLGLTKKWKLKTQVRDVVERVWAQKAAEAVRLAIRTAKRKSGA